MRFCVGQARMCLRWRARFAGATTLMARARAIALLTVWSLRILKSRWIKWCSEWPMATLSRPDFRHPRWALGMASLAVSSYGRHPSGEDSRTEFMMQQLRVSFGWPVLLAVAVACGAATDRRGAAPADTPSGARAMGDASSQPASSASTLLRNDDRAYSPSDADRRYVGMRCAALYSEIAQATVGEPGLAQTKTAEMAEFLGRVTPPDQPLFFAWSATYKDRIHADSLADTASWRKDYEACSGLLLIIRDGDHLTRYSRDALRYLMGG